MAKRVNDEVIDAARGVAQRTGGDAAVLLAVALVETNGVAFAEFSGRREPLIRFEGHYFDRLLSPANRIGARRLGLSDPQAGRVKNPGSQSGRWRLLDRAAAIDPKAAAASVSWGLCQVMGAHWQRLGYLDAAALGQAARGSEDGQFEIAARFLALGGLGAKLGRGDTAGFARGYNGPGYRANRYDTKIGAAYETATRLLVDKGDAGETASDAADTRSSPLFGTHMILCRGEKGEAIRRLQLALVQAGATIVVDGDFGWRTDAAVRTFQRKAGLDVDGLAGSATLGALGLRS